MDNPNIGILENADKLLFAEDVVSFIMTDVYFSPYEGTQATPYRDFIYTAFNDSVRVAIDDIAHRLIMRNYNLYHRLEIINEPEENDYLEIVQYLKNSFWTEGFDPQIFLVYCAHVSIIGAIFRNNGLEEAPDIAISAIFEFIMDYDMMATGWGTLTVLSSTLATLLEDSANCLTPNSLSPPWTGSEDENGLSSSTDEQDDEQSSEKGSEIHTERNGIQINMSDSKDTLVNKNTCSESLESPRMSTTKEFLQSDSNFDVSTKYKSKPENDIPLTNPIDDFFPIKDVGYETYLLPTPTEDRAVQAANTFQEYKNSSGANSEAEVQSTDTKILNKSTDSTTLQKSIVMKEDAVKLKDLNKRIKISEDNCKVVEQKDGLKSHRSLELLSSSSESSLQKEKTGDRDDKL